MRPNRCISGQAAGYLQSVVNRFKTTDMKKTWTPEQEQYLRDNYLEKTHNEMAQELGKTVSSVKSKCSVCGIVLPKELIYKRRAVAARDANAHRRLTDSEDEFVKAHYIELTMHEIARRLKRAKSAVGCSMKRQGLSLTDKMRDARMRLTKGTESHNKGKKQSEYMTIEQIEKTVATRFKKGDKVHNAKPVGSERIGKGTYIQIKVAEPRTWKFKQIWVWEQHFGPVQKGYIVIFKDNNNRNFDIDNLDCISRSQHIRMDIIAGKYIEAVENLSDNYVASVLKRRTGLDNSDIPNELIILKRAQMQINRQLNHIQKSKESESE